MLAFREMKLGPARVSRCRVLVEVPLDQTYGESSLGRLEASLGRHPRISEVDVVATPGALVCTAVVADATPEHARRILAREIRTCLDAAGIGSGRV